MKRSSVTSRCFHSGPKTIAAWKTTAAPLARTNSDPRYLETFDRRFEGLRKAGMPEE